MHPNFIRAFVSIAPDTQTSTALAAAQHSLRATGIPHVHWTRPDQIHLTLCFLGHISSQQLPNAIHALKSACTPFQRFELKLGDFGAFPNPQNPRVLWIGLTGALDLLGALQTSVDHWLSPFGDHRESKGFHPHLTLGRVRQKGVKLDLDTIPPCEPCRGTSWQVSSVLLMRSELGHGGAQHSPLAEQQLAANA